MRDVQPVGTPPHQLIDKARNQLINNAVVEVPENIVLASHQLHWDLTSKRSRAAGTGMLERFVELYRASDEEILEYAKDWGVLEICNHGYPKSHSRARFAERYPFSECELVRSSAYPGCFCEDLSVWRRFSAAADATVRLASKLSRGQRGESDSAWTLLLTRPRQPGPHQPAWMPALLGIYRDILESQSEIDWRFGDMAALLNIKRRLSNKEKLRGARGFLAKEIQTWLRIGDAGLSCYSEPDGRWRMNFSGYGTFGVLALKLMLKIADADGTVFCSTCSKAYLPRKRRPSASRANYCEECKSNGTMWREMKKRQRGKGQ